MNNLRLLAGLLSAVLSGAGTCGYAGGIITLEEIFESAEAGSLQLRPAITAVTEAEKAVSEARSEWLPDISASLSASYIGDGFTTKRDYSDYQKAPNPHLGTGMAVEVNQPLYYGGAITIGISIAGLRSKSAEIASQATRDRIRFRLACLYFELYKSRTLRSVVEGNITAAQKVLADMKVRYENGAALLNDITRYELLVSDLELRLTRIQNSLSVLNTELVTVAALPAGTEVIPDSTILDRVLPAEEEAWWQTEAANSPSLRLARNAVDLSDLSLDLAKSERLPKISLMAGWSLNGPIMTEVPPIDRNFSYWWAGIGINYNLSSLYKSNKTIARSRVTVIKANEELAAAEEEKELEINADFTAYRQAYEVLGTREKSVELAERNYKTVSTRFAEGMVLITDMLDAANARLEAQSNLVSAQIDIIYSYYKLLYTSGKI